MKDIRILRKQFRTKFIKLRFFEINFKFFSKILGKYRNNKYVEKLLDQKIPVVFLFNNINESILKSVSEILDLLRKKKEEELQENDIINNNEDNSQKITNLNKNKSLYSSFKIRNEYDYPSLTYNYGPNNDKLVETLENIVTNIKKNSKIDEEIKGDKKSNKVSKKQKNIKTARHTKVDKPVVTNKQKKTQAEQIFDEQNHAQSPDGSTDKKVVLNKQLDTQVSEDEVLKKSESTINVEKIKKDIKRFNEEIIKKNIKNAKFSKLDYNCILKNRTLSKNIYSKVNQTISSLISKNKKIRNFSEISKNIEYLSKKVRSRNLIRNIFTLINYPKINKKNISKSRFTSLFRDKSFHDNIHRHSYKLNYDKIYNAVLFIDSVIDNSTLIKSSNRKIYKDSIFKSENIRSKKYVKDISQSFENLKIHHKNIDKLGQISLYRDKSFHDNIHRHSYKFNYDKIYNAVSFIDSVIDNKMVVSSFAKKIYKDLLIKSEKIKSRSIAKNILHSIENSKIHSKYVEKSKLASIYRDKSFHDNIHRYSNRFNYDKIYNAVSFINSVTDNNAFVTSSNRKIYKDLIFKNENIKSKSITRDVFKLIENLKINKKDTKKSKINLTDLVHKYSGDVYFSNLRKFKIDTDKFNFATNKRKVILDLFQNYSYNTVENDLKNLSNVYLKRNIIYKQKMDIKNLVDESVKKIYREKRIESNTEKFSRSNRPSQRSEILRKLVEKSKDKKEKSVTKEEVKEMIRSYIGSIDFRKISDNAVSEMESKIRLDRFRKGTYLS